MAIGVKENDAVFCPTFTFFATAEAPAFLGATPVFVDSDERTFNICPKDLVNRIEQVISDGELTPKAIIAVDLFGLPANYPEIQKVAKKYGLHLIEDAAQGFGGSINGKMAASFGDIATTSFFPAKPLGCYGDGGAVFTDNDEYAELIKSLRIHGKGKDKYDNVRVGMNSRLDTIQAAVLLEKLAVFPAELVKRNEVAKYYNEQFNGRFTTPFVPEGYKSSWAQYTVVSGKRENYMREFSTQGVPTMIYYKTCMHQQTAFHKAACSCSTFTVAEKLADSAFSLPLYPYMTVEELEKVTQSVSTVSI
jgi:dTDP-4-amino-4,6-dideoxygalactose transaminase